MVADTIFFHYVMLFPEIGHGPGLTPPFPCFALEGGIAQLVNHGGLDALMYVCASPQRELNLITTTAIESFSKIREFSLHTHTHTQHIC